MIILDVESKIKMVNQSIVANLNSLLVVFLSMLSGTPVIERMMERIGTEWVFVQIHHSLKMKSCSNTYTIARLQTS